LREAMRVNVTVVQVDTDREHNKHLYAVPWLAYWLAPDGVRVRSDHRESKRAALTDVGIEVRKYIKRQGWESVEDVELDIE
jgi:hypothetical protein